MPNQDRELTQRFFANLRDLFGEDRYDFWAHGRIAVQWIDDAQELRVGCDQQYVCEHLRLIKAPLVAEACRASFGDPRQIHFSVVSPAEIERIEPELRRAEGTRSKLPRRRKSRLPAEVAQAAVAPDRPHGLGRRFALLEEFEAGEENRFSRTCCDLFVHAPRSHYSLLVQGPVASGKTHLLEGIWRATKANRPDAKIAFFTAEAFVTEFVGALKQGGAPSFHHKIKDLDLLLLDGLHVLAGKRASREQFQQWVEELIRNGKQVAVTSSLPLQAMPDFSPSFVSKLQGGLCCALAPTTLSTSTRLAERWAERERLVLPNGCHRLLGQAFQLDVRGLHGAVLSLRALAMAQDGPLTLEQVQGFVAHRAKPARTQFSLEEITQAVSTVTGATAEEIQSRSRAARASTARVLAMCLSLRFSGRSIAEIQGYFQRQSHSTILSAKKSVEQWEQSAKVILAKERPLPTPTVVAEIENVLRLLA